MLELLEEPILVCSGKRSGDRPESLMFLSSDLACVLLDGLDIDREWLFEKLNVTELDCYAIFLQMLIQSGLWQSYIESILVLDQIRIDSS